jgi:hypothetical protein
MLEEPPKDSNVVPMRARVTSRDAAFISGFADVPGLPDPAADECGGDLDGEPAAPKNAPTISTDLGAVLDRWTVEGPLVHEPTGIASLDSQTGGGLVYGTTTYLQGAPDASKTTVVVHIAHVYAERGIVVGLIAADEEASDILTRLGQRVGFQRDELEKREAGAIAVLREKLAGLPLRLYDCDATLEAAAEDLVRHANGRRVCLCVDSIQVVRCALEVLAERPPTGPAAVEARTIALRSLAWKHGLIAITTSEQSRAAYRSRKPEEQIDPLAAGKGSGSIEYKSRVLITMRKVPRLDDVVDCYPTRNKLQRGERKSFFLRIDRPRQTIEEVPAPPETNDDDAEQAARAAERASAEDAKVEALTEELYTALIKARAQGATICTRPDLLGLVKGANNIKALAVSRLFAAGRIVGGRGKPFRPRIAGEADPSDAQLQIAAAEPDAARVAQVADEIFAALSKALSAGARITTRRDLLSLVRGDSNHKGAAISHLVTTGRIQGGSGKPFTIPSPTEVTS